MTIQNNYVPVKAKGNGSTVNFSFTWPALSAAFIEVYLEDIATGVQTKQTVGTDYNVTSSDEDGGVISFVTAPSSSYNVIIARNVPITQEKPYTTSKGFEGNEIEKSFDKDVAINQQQEEELKRTVKAPLGTQNFDGTLPPLSAGKAVIIKDDLTGLKLSTFNIENIDELTQEAKDAATSANNSAIDANNAASAAAGSATSAAQSAERAKDKFKGEWSPSYPNGYMIGDTVLYNGTQWESSIDNNTTIPPEESSGISSSWKLFLPGYTGADEFIADVQEATFKGDGVTKEFNLTQKNPLLKPTSIKQILFVEVDNVVLSEKNYTIKVVGNDSIIEFYDVPPAIVDGDYNIVVRGATPKFVEVLHAVPLGGVMIFTTPNLPQGWLELNGQTISATTYPELVELLNPGQSTATLIDMRGVAARGWDNGRGLDTGRQLGDYQEDALQNITGQVGLAKIQTSQLVRGTAGAFTAKNGSSNAYSSSFSNTSSTVDLIEFDASNVARTANETRMKNVSVIYAIKAFDTVNNPGSIDIGGLAQDVNNIESKIVTGVFHAVDQKPTGVDGGTSIAGVQTRILNTVKENSIAGASLTSNLITLPAGRYKIKAKAPTFRSDRTRCYIVDDSNNSKLIIGNSYYFNNSSGFGLTDLEGFINLVSQTSIRLDHYTKNGVANEGLGVDVSDGEVEIYASIIIEKIGG